MSVVAYLRVSSKSQDAATQKTAIERAAKARGVKIQRFYSEKKSGKTLDRAELRRLRDDARAGHITKLFVFRLDRLTRSGIRDTLEVVQELRANGVELVSISDGFSLDGPASEIIIAVMGWAAQMERLALAERVAAARERVEASGGRWGRPRRMVAAEIARAQTMQREGLTVREIAQRLHVPRATVGRALAVSKTQPKAEPSTPADPPVSPP